MCNLIPWNLEINFSRVMFIGSFEGCAIHCVTLALSGLCGIWAITAASWIRALAKQRCPSAILLTQTGSDFTTDTVEGLWRIYVCVGRFLRMASLTAIEEMCFVTVPTSEFQLLLSRILVLGVWNWDVLIQRALPQLPVICHTYVINTLQRGLQLD